MQNLEVQSAALYRDAATPRTWQSVTILLDCSTLKNLTIAIFSMHPPPVTPQPEMHHLPRLDPRHYHGLAAVLWTITFERRACGWLDPAFHAAFRELLLHAAAREQLFCPAYVLMPDHIHLFWLGLKLRSDQRNAMRFLRKHIQAELLRRSAGGVEFGLQKQSNDSVLREKDRTRGALSAACFYVLDEYSRHAQHISALTGKHQVS